MKYAGQKFTCYLVHIRNHKEQPLGGRKCGGKGSCRQSTVDRACGTCLGLHLNYLQYLSEYVFPSVGRPFITILTHGARRGNGVNGCYVTQGVCHVSCCLVALKGFKCSFHEILPLFFVRGTIDIS